MSPSLWSSTGAVSRGLFGSSSRSLLAVWYSSSPPSTESKRKPTSKRPVRTAERVGRWGERERWEVIILSSIDWQELLDGCTYAKIPLELIDLKRRRIRVKKKSRSAFGMPFWSVCYCWKRLHAWMYEGCVLIFLFPVVFLVGAARNAIKRSRRKVVNPSAYKDIVK